MNKIEKVKEIMRFSEDLHMYDVSEADEEYIYLESFYRYVRKSDFDMIEELIAADGYDIGGFELLEIPHSEVFCFGNREKNLFFDIVKLFDNKWQFSYIENSENKLAHSIQEAVEKYIR